MYVPSPTSRSRKKIYLSAWDLFWAAASPPLALYLRDPNIFVNQDWEPIGYYWSLATAFAILAFFALRLHDGMTRYFSVHQALDVAEAVLFAELMTFLGLFTLTRLDGVPRSIPIVHGLLLLAGLLAARIFMRFVAADDDEAVHYGSRRERIIVIGANPLASGFIRLLEAFVPQRQTVIAVLDARSDMSGKSVSGVRVLGAPHELEGIISEFVVHGIITDRVVIAGEANVLSAAVLQEIERVCRKRQVRLSFLPRMLGFTEETQEAAAVANSITPLTSYEAAPSYFRLKRLMDGVGSAALIVLLSPVLVLAALMVYLDVGRPILFWQERLGWKGRSFLIYNFRKQRAPVLKDD
jgi:FlaA1/EpsC-like NDP-sugar epimerase